MRRRYHRSEGKLDNYATTMQTHQLKHLKRPYNPDKGRTKRYQIRVSDLELARIETEAVNRGMYPSEWVRLALTYVFDNDIIIK